MHSAKYLAAAAFAGFAAAQTCTKDIEISEATPSIDCEVVDADITVDEDVAGALVIDGPEQIKGNLIINNATGLLSIQSNTINSIGGRFELKELNSLNSITMDSLRNVNELEMMKLTSLRELTFGSEGVTKASKVRITDTILPSLSGLMLSTVESLQIDNNPRLARFDSNLINITDTLIINNNGRGMEISMDKLESASEIQIANVKSFSVAALETVDASLKLDECDNMESFAAPNLTKITDALAFINNKKLTNVSLPLLKEIGGDLRIVNNTELTELDGFPKLESAASINMGGAFESIDMPKLDLVKGTAELATTSKNDTFCNFWEDNSDKVSGDTDCKFDNEDANQGGETEGGRSASGSGSGSGDDDEDAAGIVGVNTALMGLAFIAGIAQLL